LAGRLTADRIEDHGVVWVTHATSTEPLANVAMLWASAVLGWLNGNEFFHAGGDHPKYPEESHSR
jgi:hypothetical protein